MPIYEYQCKACEHQLEALQKLSDDALKHCPECHGETLYKKISVVGFQLKGTGWYETDFKNSGAKPESNNKPKASENNKTETKSVGKKSASGTSGPGSRSQAA
jgi:putative FmdB family regulatory protein